MSYILDALRKADAQRERDASRGIHAQAASIASSAAVDEAGKRMGLVAWIAAGVVLAAIAAWFMLRSEPAPVARPAAMSAAPAAAPAPAATAITPPPPPPVVSAAPPATVPAPVQAREAAFSALPTGAPSAAAASAAAAPVAPVVAPIAGGLPADAPRLAISGGVYSPNPAQRMLIVGGQVFNEGSEVAPGVKLESIHARTAVLSFRGGRYTVAY